MHTVNGQSLEGGKTTVNTRLYFTQEMEGEVMGDELVYKATFWEADIEMDAILSHSWLLENKIGVFPHHKALELDSSNLRLLYGIKHKDKKLPKRVPICTARMKRMELVEKRKKWRLKGSYVVEDENEDMENVEWDLVGMSLPQEGFDQKTVWLNAEERYCTEEGEKGRILCETESFDCGKQTCGIQ